MNTVALDIVKKFHCTNKECPYNCCHGWKIPVDDETYSNFLNEKGFSGCLKRFFITGIDDHFIRKVFSRCPFLTKEKLCSFELNGRQDLMALICREYPKEPVLYSDYEEVTLELSCYEAARLFIENPGRMEFSNYEYMTPFWIVENDDKEFLDFLIKDREKILDFLWKEDKPFADIIYDLYYYVYREHSIIVRNKLSELTNIKIEDDNTVIDDAEFLKEQAKLDKKTGYAFFSIKMMDRMIINHVNYGNLSIREPEFYKILKHYDKLFGDRNVNSLDSYFDCEMKKMISENPSLLLKYRSYFSYNINQLYLKSYETYFILRQFLFAILYTEFLMIFDLAETVNKKRPLTKEEEARILMYTEHGVRHNPTLTENLFTIIRQEFL